MIFRNYSVQIAGLLKSTNSFVSEHLWTVHMLNGPKQFLYLHFFCHIFQSLWKETNSKKFVLEVSETLRPFVNILTPDDMYSLSVQARVFKATNWNAIIAKSKNIF